MNYLLFGLIAFNLLTSLIPLSIGIRLLAKKSNAESPWPYLSRAGTRSRFL